jgi:choline dehydrogenase-like flavoprotein
MTVTRRQLLLGLGGATLAAGAGAYGVWRWRQGPELQSLLLRELPEQSFDVCIIGSGPAGAALAQDLVERGLRTVVLESGVPLQRIAELGWSAAELDVYAVRGDPLYPVQGTRMRAVGGSSNLWTGRCSRLHPSDFEPNAYTPRDNPWPIRYEDLQDFYPPAERTLGVRGGAPSETRAPRRTPLPRSGEDVAPLRGLLRPLGISVEPTPTSHAPRFRSGPVRAGRDLLPGFTASRLGTLVTDATVARLALDASGRVTAADARSSSGGARQVRADVFVVACGGVESARLLLLSRTPRHPDGLGNASGWLGRGFAEHPNLTFEGRIRPATGGRALGRSHQFYESAKREGLGSAIHVFATQSGQPHYLRIGASVEMFPAPENRVTLDPNARDAFGSPGLRLDFRFGPRDRATLEATRERIRKLYAELGGSEVRELPLSWSHHHIGGCRMGADPGTSVVDADLRVHGTPNLYVVSSGTFVTGGAAHPTLTIVALAHRLAGHLSG